MTKPIQVIKNHRFPSQRNCLRDFLSLLFVAMQWRFNWNSYSLLC